jgi:predicted PurR-regulated permease PerM
MSMPERRTVDILLTTALLTAAVAVYCARRVILVFIFAILFTYLINPVVKFLQRHSLFFRNLRGPAVVEVYLALVLLIALAGCTFAPSPTRSKTRVLDDAPSLLMVHHLPFNCWRAKKSERSFQFCRDSDS